jgi:hypothetical protein
VLAAFNSLDNEFAKSYHAVVPLKIRARHKSNLTMTVLCSVKPTRERGTDWAQTLRKRRNSVPRLRVLKLHFFVELALELRQIPWCSYSAPAVLVLVLAPRAASTSTISLSTSTSTIGHRKVQLQNLRVGLGYLGLLRCQLHARLRGTRHEGCNPGGVNVFKVVIVAMDIAGDRVLRSEFFSKCRPMVGGTFWDCLESW